MVYTWVKARQNELKILIALELTKLAGKSTDLLI